MSDADIEVLPGFNRADVKYLAECLEGLHGDVRRVESTDGAAKFIRAALAVSLQRQVGIVLPSIPPFGRASER